jgi:hypothetical protein
MSRARADAVIDTLLFEISTSRDWRARLFATVDSSRFVLSDSDLAQLAPEAVGSGLQFAVFDGVTEDGGFVFGFECAEHPAATRNSTNWPQDFDLALR